MEKTNERKVLEDLSEYLEMQVNSFEPSSEWGKGCIEGFTYCKRYIDYLCKLHHVDLEESD